MSRCYVSVITQFVKEMFIVIILLISLFLPCQAQAVSGLPPRGEESFSKSALLRHWTHRRDLMAYSNDKTGKPALEKLLLQKSILGIKNLPDVSLALIREAKKLTEAKQENDAMELLNFAVDASPNLPEPRLARIKLYITASGSRAVSDITSLPREGKLTWDLTKSNPVRLACWGYNALLTSRSFSISALLLLIGLAFVRTIRQNIFEISFLSHLSVPAYVIGFVILLIAGTAYFAGGILLLASVLVVFSWRLFHIGEKVAITILALLLVILPIFAHSLEKNLELSSGVFHQLLTIDDGSDQNFKMTIIKSFLKTNPNSVHALFGLSLAESILGNPNNAKLILERISAIEPKFERALVNLGKIYFDEDNFDEAEKTLKQAIDINKGSFYAYYNLGKLYYREALLKEGNAALKIAKQLNEKEFQQLEHYYKKYIKSGIQLTNAGLGWQDAREMQEKYPSTSNSTVLDWQALVVFLTIALLFLLGQTPLSRIGTSTVCQKCGNFALPDLDGISTAQNLCAQCHNVYIKKAAIDPEFKIRKEREIRVFQGRRKIIARVFGALFPGAGHMYLERVGSGLIFIIVTIFVIVKSLHLPYLKPTLSLGHQSGVSVLVVLSLIGLYLFSNITLYRR